MPGIFNFIQEPGAEVKPPFLSDQAYAEARQCLPFVAVDAVIYDMGQKAIYLAWRRATPAQGWWVLGGGVKNGQSPVQAMAKRFNRETSLELPEERFNFLERGFNMTQWTRQEQISNLHIPFSVELTDDERGIVSGNLDPNEYDQSKGLEAFSLEALLLAVHEGSGYPQTVLYYDCIFGTESFPQALAVWNQRVTDR